MYDATRAVQQHCYRSKRGVSDNSLKHTLRKAASSRCGSSNVGGHSPVQRIEYKDGSKFDVKLCQDLVGSPEVLTLQRLRFSLCSTDIQTIRPA